MEADEGKKLDKNLADKEKKGHVGFSADEALKKCLEERKGDSSAIDACKSIVEAFKSACHDDDEDSRIKKPLTPFRLRSGSLTDV